MQVQRQSSLFGNMHQIMFLILVLLVCLIMKVNGISAKNDVESISFEDLERRLTLLEQLVASNKDRIQSNDQRIGTEILRISRLDAIISALQENKISHVGLKTKDTVGKY